MTSKEAPTPPLTVTISCRPGQQEFKVSWEASKLEASIPEQTVVLTNETEVSVKNYDTGNSITDQYSVVDTSQGQSVIFGMKTRIVANAVINAGGQPPFYPKSYGTMEINFPESIDNHQWMILLVDPNLLFHLRFNTLLSPQFAFLLVMLTVHPKSAMSHILEWWMQATTKSCWPLQQQELSRMLMIIHLNLNPERQQATQDTNCLFIPTPT